MNGHNHIIQKSAKEEEQTPKGGCPAPTLEEVPNFGVIIPVSLLLWIIIISYALGFLSFIWLLKLITDFIMAIILS